MNNQTSSKLHIRMIILRFQSSYHVKPLMNWEMALPRRGPPSSHASPVTRSRIIREPSCAAGLGEEFGGEADAGGICKRVWFDTATRTACEKQCIVCYCCYAYSAVLCPSAAAAARTHSLFAWCLIRIQIQAGSTRSRCFDSYIYHWSFIDLQAKNLCTGLKNSPLFTFRSVYLTFHIFFFNYLMWSRFACWMELTGVLSRQSESNSWEHVPCTSSQWGGLFFST